MSFDRERFVSDLHSLVAKGVPFRHQGRDPETGMDCIHVPAWGVRAQGIEFPPALDRLMRDYSESPDGFRMLAIMREWFTEIPVVENRVPDGRPGDLLQLYVFRNPRHMAVITKLEPLTVIEAYRSASNKTGELIERPLDWRRRIAACFRIPDFN